MKCPPCNTGQGTTVHKRLMQCPKWAPSFRKAWTQSWGMWAEYAEQWYDNASLENLDHIACLGVPRSFYSQLPRGYGTHFKERMAHHQYMMLRIVYQLRKEFTMPPRDNEETQPSQSVGAWCGKIKPRVRNPGPTPQVLQQQLMYEPRKQKRAKLKARATATREDDKECHKILQSQDSYHAKVKALKYLEFTQDTIGHQKVTEMLSAPRIKYQTTRRMQEAQDMHNNGCLGVLKERHYDGKWYRRVGTWLHYMEKTHQKWLHEVDLSHHILGLRHALIQKGLQRRTEAPHNTACSPPPAKQPCTTRKITGRTRGQGSSITPSKSSPGGSMTRFRAGDKLKSGPQVGRPAT